MGAIKLSDFLDEKDIRVAMELFKEFKKEKKEGFATKVQKEVVKPKIEVINNKLGGVYDPLAISKYIESTMKDFFKDVSIIDFKEEVRKEVMMRTSAKRMKSYRPKPKEKTSERKKGK